MIIFTTQITTNSDFLPPSTDINILQWIMQQLGHAFAFFKYQVPDFIFGGDSFCSVLLAVFIVGTIINLITGEDDDIIEDPTDDE
ncbi:MAG: hypothetical protein J6T10_22065 [Methanobrevibacter sp.]|nr:hypothetical protein [Methanobrevibacter sp.]